MGYSNFKLNGTAIKNPSSFDMEYYTLTQSTRVANGDMVMDFVANKRKFNLGYEAIQSSDLNKIIDILWTQLATTKQCFVKLEYIDDGVPKEATVYSGSIPKNLPRATTGKQWVWKDVKLSLIEK